MDVSSCLLQFLHATICHAQTQPILLALTQCTSPLAIKGGQIEETGLAIFLGEKEKITGGLAKNGFGRKGDWRKEQKGSFVLSSKRTLPRVLGRGYFVLKAGHSGKKERKKRELLERREGRKRLASFQLKREKRAEEGGRRDYSDLGEEEKRE